VSTINALGDSEGITSDCNRNFHHFSIKISREETFLFFYVVAMLQNIEVILRNIVIAIDGKMTIMGTLLGGLVVV